MRKNYVAMMVVALATCDTYPVPSPTPHAGPQNRDDVVWLDIVPSPHPDLSTVLWLSDGCDTTYPSFARCQRTRWQRIWANIQSKI